MSLVDDVVVILFEHTLTVLMSWPVGDYLTVTPITDWGGMSKNHQLTPIAHQMSTSTPPQNLEFFNDFRFILIDPLSPPNEPSHGKLCGDFSCLPEDYRLFPLGRSTPMLCDGAFASHLTGHPGTVHIAFLPPHRSGQSITAHNARHQRPCLHLPNLQTWWTERAARH